MPEAEVSPTRSEDASKTPWARTPEEVVQGWEVDPERGLTEDEIRRRRDEYGPNELRRIEARSLWSILYDQVKSLVVLLLAVAAVISFLFGEVVESAAIGVVVAINTAIGFFTELRAVRSMEALRSLGAPETTVRRNGNIIRIPVDEVVPGDVVLLEAGDAVPADCRLIEASRLQADESALTGESTPVEKSVEPVEEGTPLADRSSMVYKGTSVARGQGVGVVVGTGMASELGHISALVEEAGEEETPLEQRLDDLGAKLVWVTLAVAAIVTGMGVLGGRPVLLMVETGIALAVAAVPEGLPIVATLALARGMWRMVDRNALVRRLSSVETLGATTVIFTDKTGTLTENRMSVQALELPGGSFAVEEPGGDEPVRITTNGEVVEAETDAALRRALETAVLCTSAAFTEDGEEGVGDPMEVALLRLGRSRELDRDDLTSEWPEVREEAFDSETKMMATVHRRDGTYRYAVKGAPEAVIRFSTRITADTEGEPLAEEDRERWLRKAEEMAEDGLRVLALAEKTAGSEEEAPYEGLTFQGLVGFLDPPREDVRSALDRCRSAGVRVVMVTGDHPTTARKIAESVGLLEEDADGETVLTGRQLGEEVESEDMEGVSVFARVDPAQKLNLIDFAQGRGAIVAMTGDGVNDAPALKSADIGIAMGERGTEVAREASDMVLLDDAFSTIVAAVEQGRVIFENIRSFVRYLFSCNFAEVLTVGLASAVNAPLPILPLQILFLNLVTDVFPALALGVGEGDERVMDRPPRDPSEPILPRVFWWEIGGFGTLITASVLSVLAVALTVLELPRAEAVTLSFLTLAFAQLWHVFNMRAPRTGWARNEVTRNPWVWGAVVLCLGLLLGAVYVPTVASVMQLVVPSATGWLLAVGASLVPLFLIQLYLSLRPSRRSST